ncbi:tetratricopeptide repeat protein [Desulfogranum mediterraneum]|uniref:tetratricopeptide repeat protein n=1 Tax=Desulfogranum mediterraneum TaxID=160661 RepID=UPI000415ED8F|nr:tetratricopeptide repeat protein [Desulfogranum mediterraneum]
MSLPRLPSLPVWNNGVRRLTHLLLAGLLCSAGCAYPPPKGGPSSPTPQPQQELLRPGNSLVTKSRKAMGEQRYGYAVTLLERALRSAPHDPLLWYELARAKYGARQYAQAMEFCKRALLLVDQGSALAAESRALYVQAEGRLGER